MKAARWLDRGIRIATARHTPRAMILLYHRVAAAGSDPGIMVSPENFAQHVRIATRLADCISLGAVPALLQRRYMSRPCVVFTFDDGYLDNLLAAKPVLARHGARATVFAATSFVAAGRPFWWDRLHAAPGRSEPVTEIVMQLRGLPERERQERLRRMGIDAPAGAPADDPHRAMTPDELRTLASGDTVEVGAHTVGHAHLAALDPQQQREEIRGSKQWLEETLGRRVSCFAYPFGHRRDDYTDATVAEVRAAGFEIACTSNHGVVRRGSRLLELPRLWVDNWDADTFEQKLRGWCRYARAS